MNQKIPPEVEAEIRRRMAAGLPLPPGVVAVPPGGKVPPGAVPAGVSMGPGRTSSPQETAANRLANNPIPSGDEGRKILRAFSDCPIPEESKRLNELMQMCIGHQGPADKIEEIMAKGLVVALRANKYCRDLEKTRTVCIFSEDEELSKINEDIKATETKLENIQKELKEEAMKLSSLLDNRWKKSVSKYGLNPEKWSYRIDEEKGLIEQVDLNCPDCKGSTTIRKVRQETTELLMELDSKQEKEAKK